MCHVNLNDIALSKFFSFQRRILSKADSYPKKGYHLSSIHRRIARQVGVLFVLINFTLFTCQKGPRNGYGLWNLLQNSMTLIVPELLTIGRMSIRRITAHTRKVSQLPRELWTSGITRTQLPLSRILLPTTQFPDVLAQNSEWRFSSHQL